MSAATLDLRPTPLAAAEKRRDLSRRRAAGAAALGALSRSGPRRAGRHLPLEPSETEYDDLGNAKKQLGANGRCRTVAYDTAYGDLAISESTFTGGDCTGSTGTELTTSAVYDRGWQVVTQANGFNDECSRVEYDGFGRITKLFKPTAEAPGGCESVPSVVIEYRLTTDPVGKPYSLLHTQTLDGSEGDAYQHAWGVVDGMGRTIVTLAEGEEANQWIVNGLTEYDQKGATRRAYLPWFYAGSPDQFPLTTVAQTKYSTQRYDAFGRQVETTQLDGIVSLRTRYHALSTDMFDAGDLQPGPYQGTPASGQKDGHGRVVRTTERVKVGGTIEERYVDTTYLPSGEVKTITRRRGSDSVVRWMRYDSLGRMVWNVEPSTSKPFNPNPNTAVPDVLTDGRLRAWRYAYNDAGDLVGTSDARGCGVNFHYDGAGRLVAEDYSPCEAQHAAYSAADAATGLNTEVFYQYDGPGACAKGKLVFVKDRASSTSTDYDCRGRVKNLAKQIALPGAPSDDPNTRYASRIYSQSMTYDVADRPVTQSTGATHANIVAANGESTVTTTYTARGTVKSVTSSYGDLVTRIVRDAEGKVLETEYGDGAHTTTTNTYDDRRRLRTVQTYRAPPAAWNGAQNGPPETFQLLLEDSEYFYDVVDNPIEIKDWRTPSEWPVGAKPVSRQMEYDDLYRLKRLTYKYEGGDDGWVSPFAAENAGAVDARRATPTPHVSFDKRPLEQTYNYDWLGNTTSTGDDAHGFYDRSLGAVTNDTYRITSATLAGPRGGSLDVAYDAAGNMTGLRVQRSGACLPVGATCAQRYAYEWDEVGRLNVARRWDFAGPPAAAPPPVGTPPAVELRYAYDAGDDRTIKTAVDPSGNELHTLYVFGSLELRRTGWVSGDYDLTDQTESAYLSAHGLRLARLVYETDGVPLVGGDHLHVFFELGDHLGSTSTVLDRATGELVEKGTYQAYGGVESSYRPGRWKNFREDYRFTGKEEDVEVGLVYFGKRFLNSQLGRWISPDPLTVHVGGADANTYAYVSGAALRATDPLGLAGCEGDQCTQASGANQSSSGMCSGSGDGCENTGTPPTAASRAAPQAPARTKGEAAMQGPSNQLLWGAVDRAQILASVPRELQDHVAEKMGWGSDSRTIFLQYQVAKEHLDAEMEKYASERREEIDGRTARLIVDTQALDRAITNLAKLEGSAWLQLRSTQVEPSYGATFGTAPFGRWENLDQPFTNYGPIEGHELAQKVQAFFSRLDPRAQGERTVAAASDSAGQTFFAMGTKNLTKGDQSQFVRNRLGATPILGGSSHAEPKIWRATELGGGSVMVSSRDLCSPCIGDLQLRYPNAVLVGRRTVVFK